MDAYKAMKVIFGRVQSLVVDPDMASRAMGALLNQDRPHADMIGLSSIPDNELLSLITDLASPDANNKLALSPPSLYPSSTWAVTTGARGDDFVELSWSPASSGGHGHRGSLPLSDAVASNGRLTRPCRYFARRSCKNGDACRYAHEMPYDGTTAAARAQMAVAFLPPSPPSLGGLDFRVRQQQHRQHQGASSQRSNVATPAMRPAGNTTQKLPSPLRFRSSFDLNNDTISNGELQIYIAFPASNTFTEDEISTYFSGFGPVQDVRIPPQAKRMFGFVAFVYAESVRLALAKRNPHLVCGSRVIVKPYKEKKEKTPKHQQLMPPLIRSHQYSLPSPPDVSHLLRPQNGHERMMMYMPGSSHDAAALAVQRKKMEEQQEMEAAELQRAIKLQNRHFMEMQLQNNGGFQFLGSTVGSPADGNGGFNLENSTGRNIQGSNRLSSGLAMGASAAGAMAAEWNQEQQYEEKEQDNNGNGTPKHLTVSSGARQAVAPNVVWEDSDLELNLPENPFYSPTKVSIAAAEPSTPAASLKCPGSSLSLEQLD